MSTERPGLQHQEKNAPEKERIAERVANAIKVFDTYLHLKPGERVLFVSDTDPAYTDRTLTDLLKQGLRQHGNELDEIIGDETLTREKLFSATKNYSLVWLSWGMEDTDLAFHELTRFIEEKQKRMVLSHGIRAESLDDDGAFAEDKNSMDERLGKMEQKLQGTHGFHIQTTYGTNLFMGMKHGERRWFKENGEIRPGGWNNLPGGEIFTTPDEEDINGVLALPVLLDEITTHQGVDKIVYLTIRNGKIAKIDGGKSAEKLRKYLREYSKEETADITSVLQCAEIAFGANSKARPVVSNPEGKYTDPAHSTFEAEKRLGTMHIAFGSTKHGEEGTEGHTKPESDMHLDFVIPRNGLTVTAFKTHGDFKKRKHGERLIDEGRWNFI